jgi:hypothetical protein
MDNIKKIQNNIESLKIINNLKDKINKMKEIKKEIDIEQEASDKLLKKLNDNKPKKIKKYKTNKIDELETMFQNSNDFDEKINIFNHLCYKIDKIEEELFGTNDSDSDNIEFESEDSENSDSSN